MKTVFDPALWQEAYEFWFNELDAKQWFASSIELDQTITNRFSEALKALELQSKMPPVTAESLAACNIRSVQDNLAAILITDQFSRNIHRGSAKAFATDALALSLSKYLQRSHELQHLKSEEIQFALMPFMHDENLESQQTSVALYTQYGIKLALKSAIEHKDLIERFGRYPHRNELLGRESTQEELEYLKTGKTFGQ